MFLSKDGESYTSTRQRAIGAAAVVMDSFNFCQLNHTDDCSRMKYDAIRGGNTLVVLEKAMVRSIYVGAVLDAKAKRARIVYGMQKVLDRSIDCLV